MAKKNIPKNGLSQKELFHEMDNSMHSDMDWKAGKTFGAVYYPGEEYSKVISKAYVRFMHENAFDPQLFSSILTMENEVVEQVRMRVLLGITPLGIPSELGAILGLHYKTPKFLLQM